MVIRPRTKATTDEPMGNLLTKEGTTNFPRIGELVRGKVVSIGKSEIIIDIQGVFSGVIRGYELKDELGISNSLEVGQDVEAVVLDLDNERGMLELSLRSASHQRAWNTLIQLKQSGENVEVEVTGANRGGVMVKLNNIYGFLPVSQLSRENYPNVEGNKNLILEHLQRFVRKKLLVKVIDVSESEEKLIVSEKEAALDLKLSTNFPYVVGDRVSGVVKGITDFGVFIEFGEFEGLIHVSEIPSEKAKDLKNSFTVGEPVTAEIVSIHRGRVALSLKRLIPEAVPQAADTTSGTTDSPEEHAA